MSPFAFFVREKVMVSRNGGGRPCRQATNLFLEFCRVLVRLAVCTETATRRFEMTLLGETFRGYS
jgi:hypothetical protein